MYKKVLQVLRSDGVIFVYFLEYDLIMEYRLLNIPLRKRITKKIIYNGFYIGVVSCVLSDRNYIKNNEIDENAIIHNVFKHPPIYYKTYYV